MNTAAIHTNGNSEVIIGNNAIFDGTTDTMLTNYAKSKIEIGDNAIFKNGTYRLIVNTSNSTIKIGKNAIFEGNNYNNTIYTNISQNRGAILFNYGDNINNINNITFEDGLIIRNNLVGSVLYNGPKSYLTFDGSALIENNGKIKDNNSIVYSTEGTLRNFGIATFNGNTIFKNNISSSDGGAILNSGKLIFNSDVHFSGNTMNGVKNDIENRFNNNFTDSATIIFKGETEFDGGIINNGGSVNFEDSSFLIVGKHNSNIISGTTGTVFGSTSLILKNGMDKHNFAIQTGINTLNIKENLIYNIINNYNDTQKQQLIMLLKNL